MRERRIFAFLIGLTLALAGAAQQFHPVEVTEEPCVHLDANHLIFPGKHQLFDSLYTHIRQMNRLGRRHLNIVHIGGSHVQGGSFSHELRTLFSQLSPRANGSRGLIFPWKIANSTAPTNYSLDYTGSWTRSRCLEAEPDYALGLSGAAVITSDPVATLHLELLSGIEQWAFNRVRILGESIGGARPFLVTPRGDTLQCRSDNRHRDLIFRLPQACSAFTLGFRGMKEGSKFVLRGIVPENDNAGVTYTECGVNGASVFAWLRCSLFSEELKRICPPDLVILGLGINDANVTQFNPETYKANYRQLMSHIHDANPHAALLFITNNDCWLNVSRRRYTYNRNTMAQEQAVMELAREYNAAVWNQYQVMGGYSSSSQWVKAGLMKRDHIHFQKTGYTLLAHLLYNAFIEDINKK